MRHSVDSNIQKAENCHEPHSTYPKAKVIFDFGNKMESNDEEEDELCNVKEHECRAGDDGICRKRNAEHSILRENVMDFQLSSLSVG